MGLNGMKKDSYYRAGFTSTDSLGQNGGVDENYGMYQQFKPSLNYRTFNDQVSNDNPQTSADYHVNIN